MFPCDPRAPRCICRIASIAIPRCLARHKQVLPTAAPPVLQWNKVVYFDVSIIGGDSEDASTHFERNSDVRMTRRSCLRIVFLLTIRQLGSAVQYINPTAAEMGEGSEHAEHCPPVECFLRLLGCHMPERRRLHGFLMFPLIADPLTAGLGPSTSVGSAKRHLFT